MIQNDTELPFATVKQHNMISAPLQVSFMFRVLHVEGSSC